MQSKLSQPAWMIPTALVACALWGSAFPCVKLGYSLGGIEGSASQIYFAGLRFVIAGGMTWIFGSILQRGLMKIPTKAFIPAGLFGLIQTSLHYYLFYTALSFLTGTMGSMINGTSAIFSIVMAWIFPPHEKMNSNKVIGACLGLCGIIYLNYQGLQSGSTVFLGCLLMLTAAMVQGFSNVLLSRISGCAGSFQITCLQLLVGGGVLILIGKLLGGEITQWSGGFVALLLYMSFITSAAFSIWTSLMRVNPVSKVAVFMLSIPIFGVVFSGLILGEAVFTATNIIALLLICSGIYFVNRSEHRCRDDN